MLPMQTAYAGGASKRTRYMYANTHCNQTACNENACFAFAAAANFDRIQNVCRFSTVGSATDPMHQTVTGPSIAKSLVCPLGMCASVWRPISGWCRCGQEPPNGLRRELARTAYAPQREGRSLSIANRVLNCGGPANRRLVGEIKYLATELYWVALPAEARFRSLSSKRRDEMLFVEHLVPLGLNHVGNRTATCEAVFRFGENTPDFSLIHAHSLDGVIR